ncbi:hypothetical protein BDW22DRAFT_1060402 [Trametopsis cervina]|nr:hypothetical protein BDW22DRAFT_1060402 [Trametopsis cervina]
MSSPPTQHLPLQLPVEEDISKADVYTDSDTSASPTTRVAKTDRQRQKQRDEGPFADEEDDDTADETDDRRGSYPPPNDEVEESRRIEENLRQWEVAERQRRKAARDSSSTVASASLVTDVTRRASLLWSGKRSRPPVQGAGQHHIVPSSEDGVPMDDFENDTAVSVSANPENPFATPNASTVSLNTPGDSAIMTEASDSTGKDISGSLTVPTASSHDKSKSRSHPPPQPLGLPEPRSPPPRTGTPHASRPPEPIPPPTIPAEVQEEELPDKRWWTDWLCGCRERGDNQTGRTNPFE